MTIVERLVPDELWELFQRVVPAAPTRPQGGGRRRHGDREVLAAIVFVATSGCTWAQLPPCFGPSGPTAHRRFAEWAAARVWAKLYRLVLDELGARGESDWSRCAVDSVNMRALKKVPLWLSSSGGGGRGLVEGAISEHGEKHIDAASGECDEGGDVVLAFASFPVVVGA
ncbi:transposase [Kitasatospora cineracea]|uniref:Transposase n=1 Tax=Kitasatospora cineracea TaxID=88074 RepID=A0A8G1US86_9ACTN|nr:transposase [Kitasatospora cineracea]